MESQREKSPDKARKLKELGSGKILPLIWEYSWPAQISMALSILYNVVDSIYIGHECGPDAIAGLALTFPFMTFLMAVGMLLGVSSGAVMSIRLGQKDMDGAERTLGQCVALKGLVGLAFAPVLYFLFDPLLHLMAADGVTGQAIEVARTYLKIVIFFHVFGHLAYGLSACMRAEGSPIRSMVCMLSGFLTNFLLDPIFIFRTIDLGWLGLPVSFPGLGMGVAGAAWATNIAMVLSCAIGFLYVVSPHAVVRLKWRQVGVYRDLAPQVLAIGLSPFLMQFAGSAINFSFNRAFAIWSASPEMGTIQIAAFGIYQRIIMLFLIPAIGLQQGVGPIIGYNWGARKYDRVRHSFNLSILLTTAIVVVAAVMQVCFPRFFASLFVSSDNGAVLDASSFAISFGNCMIWVIGLNVAATTYFQSVGRPKTAILLSLLRQVICLIPCVWLLPHILPCDPILAIWAAMPISDLLAFVATIYPVIREERMLSRLHRDLAGGLSAA